MKKYKNYLILISVFLIPTLVFASSGDATLSIEMALGMEAFVSIHMSVFVFSPLSKIFSPNNSKKMFWTLFVIRAAILIFFDLFITTSIAIVDFIAVFVGAFLVVPISAVITKKNTYGSNKIKNISTTSTSTVNHQLQTNQEIVINCTKCGGVLKVTDKFCTNCGAPFDNNNVTVSTQPKVFVNALNFDPIFNNTEDKLLEEFINRELVKTGIDNSEKIIPEDVLKRKNVLNIIFSILVFVYISLIFFHFPIYTYIIGIVILFIFFKITRKYNLMKYLKKEVKSRPNEKISNVVINVKNSSVTDNAKIFRLGCILIAIILPLIIFMKPRIMYEHVENGYAVRFYTFGLTNFKTAVIPETYKGENVVSLRGNTFSNMPFLETVTLPNTITEIRGQAFKNNFKLVSVNIPTNLEYLGGGAFYNCSSLTSVTLPDTLTFMGGETFYGASSLEYVKLSNNLTEIRGDTFGYCSSLRSISIPDNVTRIGGHAFYGATSLSEVSFTINSKLVEIGSSAFRKCTSLYSITIPSDVYVNERAFKESPTTIHYLDSYKNSYYNYDY